MSNIWKIAAGLGVGLLALGLPPSARAQDKPKVIRISYPGVGVGNRPAASGNIVATAHLLGLFEQEFKPDGISIEWSFLRGAGPAVNELFANGLVDFSPLGDLPSVIGRASGLKHRVLVSAGVRGNIYVAVPADSSIKSLSDLKGKRVAVAKGTATHLAGAKILESVGLSEKDVKIVNMDVVSAQLALTTRDIDAALGGTDYLRLRDQGVARIIFTTRGADPALTSNGLFIGSEAFINKYPALTTRVVKVLVKSARWIAEANPADVYKLWTKSGTTFSSFREELQGEDLKYRTSPLLDPYVFARYALQIQQAHRLNLSRTTFDFKDWVEPKFLQAALKELNLETYWQPRGQDGKPVAAPPAHARLEPAPAEAAPAGLAAR